MRDWVRQTWHCDQAEVIQIIQLGWKGNSEDRCSQWGKNNGSINWILISEQLIFFLIYYLFQEKQRPPGRLPSVHPRQFPVNCRLQKWTVTINHFSQFQMRAVVTGSGMCCYRWSGEYFQGFYWTLFNHYGNKDGFSISCVIYAHILS